jgi:SAM-dependent methyltransferase
MSALKSWIKRQPGLKRASLAALRFAAPVFAFANLRAIPAYFGFFADLRRYRTAGGRASLLDAWPCLFDRTAVSGVDTHYFHQAVWAMRRIRDSGTPTHVDIGSEVNFVGLLTTFTAVTFVDIRPLELAIENYKGLAGSITALPFESDTVGSLSTLPVIEHIGLGRYGDPLDPRGAERAAAEIVRVLRPGGRAYISTPVGRPRVQFNGQRVFAIPEIPALFRGLTLAEFSLVDAHGNLQQNIDPASADIREDGAGLDCGLGMYRFEKPADAQ